MVILICCKIFDSTANKQCIICAGTVGWSIGFAHVRGGGEMGQGWHLQGKKNNKWNTFNDFSACARYLIENGILCTVYFMFYY